ncbi:sigma-54 interaction domain-containing protein [Geosporobacter ferrireducens]|uniref:Sigma-54-dependent Fis family transcriptional regulator n=1 Tax=Geosporobacter ferrireducens TaxID=1424294 RepID=A0A1D8GJA4_9FIRM|nr:sigma 54-interacting transcriptional regulator [Geosporobacter ferrireducens]AOT70974.1 sigma-54-dependent Fis family transcriptional regulator [Geosporobacter ferrireducens]
MVDYKFLLASILKQLDEGILVVDTDANVTFYNEPATNIAGITPEIAIGKNILEIFPDLTPETSTFYNVLKNKEPIIDYVQTYMNFQGKKVSTVTSTIPLMKKGELVGALEIYRDFTQVKELSEKISNLQSQLFKKNGTEKIYKGNGTVYTFEDIIGESSGIKKLKEKALKIADSSSPVLVYGETGTGKELLVQAIHNASRFRKNKPFIAQNCAALPKSLLESILFGTASGSFTGAKDKPGLFELADGGTLFLDEINSMDIELQGKLLRVLQDGIIRRVGGTNTITVDVRIIASTNEDPLKAVEKKILRQDLYYRLNVINLNILPLRERREDIPMLINFFINMYNKKLNKKVKDISAKTIEALCSYIWPGNVRELKYALESTMNFIEGDIIALEDIPQHIFNGMKQGQTIRLESARPEDIPPLSEALDRYERELIQKAIENTNGNCAKAARLLKIPRQTLHNKVKKYKIMWQTKI